MDFHNTPEAMAKCLLSYIPDLERVQREVAAEFGGKCSMRMLKDLRASIQFQAKLADKVAAAPSEPVQVTDKTYANQMKRASKLLVERIIAAREQAA